MLIVQHCIVTEDIAECCFWCDLERCKGQCCVEGDAGAPLTDEEVAELQRLLPQVKPYMSPAGRDAVEVLGVSETDCTDEPCTTLVDDRECAFVVWHEGKALCALERACRDGQTRFLKPVSCHLYPLRITDYGEFTAVNYHRWDVCRDAVREGERRGVPLYVYLREPLVRRFGEQWYAELVDCCEAHLARVRGKKKE